MFDLFGNKSKLQTVLSNKYLKKLAKSGLLQALLDFNNITQQVSSMNNLETSQNIRQQACRYLKNRCKMVCNSNSHKIRTFYKDVSAHLLDESNPHKDQSLSKNNSTSKLEYIFLPLIQKFQERQEEEFLCSKAFSSKTKESEQQKYFKVFKCYQCSLEDNAICCVQCFDFAKHKGHHYELIDIQGGCCDCGDENKWDKNGFCQKHTIKGDLEETQNQVQRSLFFSFCEHGFLILCKLYSAYKSKELQIQKLSLQKEGYKTKQPKQEKQKKILDQILKIVDAFGYHFLKSLVNINKNRYEINQMTRQWLDQTITPQQKLKLINMMPTKQLILRFRELRLMGETCVELYLILFNRAQKFRRQTTINYFKLLSQLPSYTKSSFRFFSAQLFSSSNLILDLISNKQIKPLTFKKFILHTNQSKKLQDKIKSLNIDYKNLIFDLDYLVNLKEQSLKAYWNCFSFQYGFEKLMTFEEVFNEKQQYLKLAHRHSYFLQESALKLVIKIIDKMNGDESFIICNLKRLTLRLFERYFSSQRPNLSEQNLFFTDERMWGIFLFAYFSYSKQIVDMNILNTNQIKELLSKITSDSSGPAQINERLAHFKIEIHKFYQLLEILISQVLRRFFNISQIMKSNTKIKQSMSFAMAYYKSKNLLYSVDAFLLRFSLIAQPHNNQSLSKKMIDSINYYFNKMKGQFEFNLKKLQRRLNQTQRSKVIICFQQLTICFHNFLNLISQSLNLTYHELILLSSFETLLKKGQYEKKFLGFYDIILSTWCQKERRESLLDFKKTFEHLFFKQDHFFPKFLKQYDQKKLPSQKQRKQEIINLQYFYSLRFKMETQKYINKFIRKKTFRYVPFNIKSDKGLRIITSTMHLKLVGSWLQQAIKIEDFHQSIINDLTKQLFKIQILSKSPDYHLYFRNEFNQLYCEQQVSNQVIKNSVYSYLNQDIVKDLIYNKQDYIVQVQPRQQSESSQSQLLPSDINQESDNEHYRGLYNVQSRGNQVVKEKKPQKIQVELKKFIEKSCMLAQTCIHKNREKNESNENNDAYYQLCFINVTNLYCAFQIDKLQKILAFSACGHFIHKKCYKKQLEQSKNKKILMCKRCQKKYNLIISSFDYSLSQDQNRSARRREEELISADFQKISDFLSPYKNFKSIQIEIFKAIAAFLLNNVIIDDFHLLQKGLCLYKNLYKKLKFIFQKHGNSNLLHQRSIKKSDNSAYIDFIDFVIERLAYQFRINYSEVSELQKRLKHQKSANYVLQILNFFESHQNKWTIIDPSQFILHQPIKRINLENFPQNLAQLQQKKQCWKCHSKQRHSYYICLFHASNLKEVNQYCVCFLCSNNWIKQHLQQEKDHCNETLMIRTDTGQVCYYFYIRETDTLMSYTTDSIYLNSIMSCYELGKKYQISDFKKSQKRVKHVINRLRSWNFLLDVAPV